MKPHVSDEQMMELAEGFIDRKTTLAVGSGQRANREILVCVFGEEIRDLYEPLVTSQRERIAELEGALKELLNAGQHDGPCDNQGHPEDPCSIHMKVYATRKGAARALLTPKTTDPK